MPLGTLIQFLLPRWAIQPLAPLIGSLIHRINRRGRERLADNLRHILGKQLDDSELNARTRRAFTYLVANYLDLLRIPVTRYRTADIAELDSRAFDRTLAGGRGAIIVTAHIGNWDLAGAFLAARGYKVSAVVEPIPRGWTRTFDRYRRATRMETIPIHDHRAIARALERNRILALVADRDLTGRGIKCPSFDSQRSFPKGPAAYALKHAKPVVVGYFVFQRQAGRPPYFAAISLPLEYHPTGEMSRDVEAYTQIIAHELNQLIAKHPEQWLVFNAGWQ